MSRLTRFAAGAGLLAIALLAVFFFFQNATATAESSSIVPDPAPAQEALSLQTATAEEGFQLAITLARKGVTETQPDKEVLHALRPNYAHDADALMMASQVIAIHFQTVAAANNYWRD